MTKTYSHEEIALNDLGATDLRAEAAEWDGDTHAYRITIYDDMDKPEVHQAEALIIDGRTGIAWGADASWAESFGSIEQDIECWLNDGDTWADRN